MIKNILTLVFICFSFSIFGQEFITTWTTTNLSTGSSANNQITIPTNSAYTYNYSINWGDTNTDNNVTGNITHTYASPGNYTVSITGTFPAIYFNNTGDRNKIIEILNWGDIQWQSMENAFYGCENLNFDLINSPDLSQVTSLKNMFKGCTIFNGIVNNWNVSTITDISGLFSYCEIFNRPLDNWNTIAVTDMSETFRSCYEYNEPLDNWNTASVTNMQQLFRGATQFNQNINNWDVSQVTNMASTFEIALNYTFPLNNWNVSQVTNMSRMFYRCRNFNQPLNNWNVSKVTNMREMFYGFLDMPFNQNINNWDVSNVTDMAYMFRRCASFNQPLNNWDVTKVTDMSHMFEEAENFNQPIEIWNVSSVVNMTAMFNGENQNMAFNQPLNNWNVSNVINMSQMFNYATSFAQPLNSWNVSSVTNMSLMFRNADAFNQPLGSWNVGNVANFQSMFQLNDTFNQPLNSWNLSNATNISSMFSNAINFNQPLDTWSVSTVTNMSGVFNSATSFDQNIGGWNLSAVTNMANMLSNSGISQANYDNILISWSGQTVKPNITLGATNLKYCDALNQRQSLITDDNWTITGDSVNCSYVLCSSIISPINGDQNVPANSSIRWNAAPNATGYRVSIRRQDDLGNVIQVISDNEDFGNVLLLNFTNEFIPGDNVFVTVVPYNNDGPATGCQEISFKTVASWVNRTDVFKITIDTRNLDTNSTAANQYRIDLNDGYPDYLSYDFNIDWGDGQYDNHVTTDVTHTYLNQGIYTLAIIGDFPSFRQNSSNRDNLKLISMDQWGAQEWKSMNQTFYFCENMEYNATDVPNLSQVTNMASMFRRTYLFNSNINNWNVSNVTNMSSLFYQASIFNQPLDTWDVSNVTTMYYMFAATAFNQNINSWNVGNVTTMQSMFTTAREFNQPLIDWDVSKVTTTENMFYYAEAFDQPLNNWDVSAITNMSQMFDTATSFNRPLNSWDVSNVSTMESMFRSATAFNQPLNSWIVSSVNNMASMFSSASVFNQPLNNWNVSSVANMSTMFSGASAFNQNINAWNVTNVITMRSMFNYATSFNQPLNNWDVNSVVDMSSTFRGAAVFNQPLNNWDVSAVATMNSMFEDAVLFNQPINTWNVSSVTLMESMFEDAATFNQPLSNWNTSVVTNFNSMFKKALVFNEPISIWDTGEALNMAEMFSGALVFNQNLNSWNVSYVTTMEEMFKDAAAFNQSLDSWNVASVTTMKGMLQGAASFNSTIDSWNVRKVLTMENMFSGATSFNQTLNSWRVNGVTNMNSMFHNATTFNQTLDRWDIGAVTMRSMLDGATAYNQYLGDWNIAGVTDMRDMLDRTALTRENYDNTLISWSEQTVTPGVTLGAQGLPYCDAVEERQSMITNFSWTILDDVLDCPKPECTQLISPLNGATNVPVNTNLNWEPALFARGYRLTVGTTPSGNNIVNNQTVNDTSYEFAPDFTGGETVYVTIIPFNDEGDAVGPCTEESFIISSNPATEPSCTLLTEPLNNATDVPVTTDLSWQPIANADGYRLTVGTSSGGNQILDNVNVGNATTYDLANNLPENTQIFITIIPYNNEGNATPCSEESFTTELIPVPPTCTNLTSPLNGATNVVIDTDLSWNAVSGATGYLVVIGTTQGGIEIVNNVDVLNSTTYNIPDDLLSNRTYYVTIIPYNEVGDALGCAEESFRTRANTLNDPPACTNLSAPLNNAIDVAIDIDISWNAVSNTTGYNLKIGTSADGNEILTNTDVGNVTTYNLPTDLPETTTIYVSIVPFNSFGSATACTEQSFTTETIATIPNCTSLSSPLNNATNVVVGTDISWTAISNATGYNLTVGTTTGGSEILPTTNIGNITTYNHPTNLPEATTIYVSIVPFNTTGNATNCTQQSFTTETLATIPNCTALTSPLNNANNVAIGTDISWTAISNATGYNLTIGTSVGGNEILPTSNVGNITTYNLPNDLPEATTIYVSIVPFNAVGSATNCTQQSFTTETLATIPACTTLTSPLNNATNVVVGTDFSWTAISNATGYNLTIGTSIGGSEILPTANVGNITTYNLPNDLPEATTIYISIVPFNTVGNATSCTQQSFTTETLATIPNCTTLISPRDGDLNVTTEVNLRWEEITNAEGYRISIGTTAGGTDILNTEDVGFLTSYDLIEDLPFASIIYVSIIPYNAQGDAIGCSEVSFTTEVEPLVESEYGFSPNGDGINDFWEIKGIENSPENSVFIYNRWGDLVFTIHNYDNQNNVFSGDANNLTGFGASTLPNGTYFFDIQITGTHNLKKLKGFVVLKR